MTISRKYARELVMLGRAREDGILWEGEPGFPYVILTRFDLQRTDHYPATDADIARSRSLDHVTARTGKE